MLVYLDSATSRRGQPNENFARELMELFTLGEGKYGEQDIKEAARAFTGWSIDLDTGEYLFRPRIHDDGVKTVLGRTVRSGDEVLDVLLAHPATAVRRGAALARVRLAHRSPRACARRGRVSESGYESARACASCVQQLLGPEPRCAHQVAGRPRRRHHAPVRIE
jgi:uncharacterized protein (DUF1800 family)